MMTMTASQSKLLLQLNKFYNERVQSRRASVAKNLRDVCSIVQDVLKEVETQEPRFVSSLSELNGHYEGLQVCRRFHWPHRYARTSFRSYFCCTILGHIACSA